MEVAAHDDRVGRQARCTMVQLFTGITSEHTAIYPMHTKADYHHALEEFIQEYGVM